LTKRSLLALDDQDRLAGKDQEILLLARVEHEPARCGRDSSDVSLLQRCVCTLPVAREASPAGAPAQAVCGEIRRLPGAWTGLVGIRALDEHGDHLVLAFGTEPGVAAQAVVDDLLADGLDESVGGQPLERRVEGPGLQLDPPVEICSTSVRSRLRSPVAGDLLDPFIHGDPAPVSDRHVLIGTGRLTRKAQHGVAVLKQSLSRWVHDLPGERVKRPLSASAAQNRQRDPLADHRDMAGLKDRPGGLLEAGEVRGYSGGVIAGA
jgi:hypothetical protein